MAKAMARVSALRRGRVPVALALAALAYLQARAFLATAGRARTQISRPALQEEAEEEPWDPDSIEVLPTEMKQLRVGQELQGVVTRVTDRIALVSVGVEKDGLLPASKLAEGRVDNVQDQLKQGDMIQVWVAEVELGEDIRNSKLVLAGHKNKIVSLYQFGNQSSIDDLEAVYNKQEAEAAEVWYDAMVTGVKEFGVIVAFRVPGVPGIASGLVYKPGAEESGINVLDKVKVRISGVDRSKGRGRLQLRMDGAGRADRAAVLSEFKEIIGQTLEGEVVDFADFGAFVQVQTPSGKEFKGLLPITEIKNDFVEDVAEEFEMGQKLTMKLIGVNDKGIRLSLKALAAKEEELADA